MQIVYAALGEGSFEPVVVADDKGGQIAGVGTSGHDHPVGVNPVQLHGPVGGGQHIAHRTEPPVLVVAILKIAPIPARTTRIAVDNAISARGQILKFEPHRRPRPVPTWPTARRESGA